MTSAKAVSMLVLLLDVAFGWTLPEDMPKDFFNDVIGDT